MPAVCDHFRSFDLEVAGGEVRVHEVRELLRHWIGSELGQRPIAERAGVDRKTVRCYVDAAVGAGVVRDGGLEQPTDELIGRVINASPHPKAAAVVLATRALIGVLLSRYRDTIDVLAVITAGGGGSLDEHRRFASRPAVDIGHEELLRCASACLSSVRRPDGGVR